MGEIQKNLILRYPNLTPPVFEGKTNFVRTKLFFLISLFETERNSEKLFGILSSVIYDILIWPQPHLPSVLKVESVEGLFQVETRRRQHNLQTEMKKHFHLKEKQIFGFLLVTNGFGELGLWSIGYLSDSCTLPIQTRIATKDKILERR